MSLPGHRASADAPDLREVKLSSGEVVESLDGRVYFQLQVFTSVADPAGMERHLHGSGLDTVLYANLGDPTGVGVLIATERADDLVLAGRQLLSTGPFQLADRVPELTMTGRTYATGYEPDLEEWLVRRPLRHALDPECPWAIWYPVRRKPAFYALPAAEQGRILAEHGGVGRQFAGGGYAKDVRLECFGMDTRDNDFVIGLVGPRLDWLSKLVKAMRSTRQTSEHIEALGPFFVGRVLGRSEFATE